MKKLSTAMGGVFLDKGEIIIITEGDYDDYGIEIVMEVLKDFDIYEATKAFIKSHPAKRTKTGIDDGKFILWLVLNDYIEKTNVWEWHLKEGSVSGFSIRDI